MTQLNDPSKTCIYIQPDPADESEDDVGDAEEGEEDYEVRFEAYKKAWRKCLSRVRNILQALNTPVAKAVVAKVDGAYDDILPGLPYPELPIVALYGANSALLSGITSELATATNDSGRTILQVHLYPADCSNVMNMMKALVTGFVDRESGARRKPTSLASYDINLLRAWYAVQEAKPRLVVLLHEFEKFDANVVSDVFYICSLHVPQLPLVFVLLMASPPTPSFLHSAYSRSTLALLRVEQLAAPTGITTTHEVLTKTLFDPDFEPDVMLGPSMLEYITDFAARHTASPDALVTTIQLAYMKHFSSTLSVFVHDDLLGTRLPREAERLLQTPGYCSLSDAIQARLLSISQSRPGSAKPPQDTRALLAYISTARTAFRTQVRRMRVAFAIARIAERIALGEAPSALLNGRAPEGRTARLDSLETLHTILRGRVGSQIRYVCMAVRKLPVTKLRALLQELHSFWYGLQSAAVRREAQDARLWIVEQLNQLPEEVEVNADAEEVIAQDAETKQLASTVGQWLQEYIEERLVRLEDCALWDIWYSGSSPFPSELINPAPRPAVVAALLHPYDFVKSHAELTRADDAQPHSFGDDGEGDAQEPALWELPDTSIAFRRYIEAGRMVNVYDWFESFAVVLDRQRKHLRRRAEQPQVNGRGKGKGKTSDVETDEEADEDEDMDEEEEEKWKVEVQARFIRALHEIDYMGFVKHTGRKADHVIRTIYDVPDI